LLNFFKKLIGEEAVMLKTAGTTDEEELK